MAIYQSDLLRTLQAKSPAFNLIAKSSAHFPVTAVNPFGIINNNTIIIKISFQLLRD